MVVAPAVVLVTVVVSDICKVMSLDEDEDEDGEEEGDGEEDKEEDDECDTEDDGDEDGDDDVEVHTLRGARSYGAISND